MRAFIFILFVTTYAAYGEKEKLPFDSLDVLMNLQEYEVEQRAKAEKAISQKRELVVRVLRSHMARETKSGDLDAALALKKTIESLEAEDTPKNEPNSKPRTGDGSLNIAGTTWKATADHGNEFQFLADGVLKVNVPTVDQIWTWSYRVADGKVFITPHGQAERAIELTDGNTRFSVHRMGEFKLMTK